MALKNPILSNPIEVDISKLNEILDALSKANPTGVDGISTGAVRLYEVSSGKWQWQLYNGTSWEPVPFLQHNVDQLDGYHAAITPTANTVAVRNASGLLQDSITGNAATASSAATLSQTLPVNKGGTGATTSEAARSNLGVPPTSHASTATTYGVGNSTQYGHLKLSDATDSVSSISGGVAATPAAVKVAKDAAKMAYDKAVEAEAVLPAGFVIAFAANSNPSGYLLCNGAAVSRTTYAALFAAIGTTYGAGDGSTTFNLPNLMDKFIQGSGTAGTVIVAGLPNLWGWIGTGVRGTFYDASDLFEISNRIADWGGIGSQSLGNTFVFNANKHNSIYGGSTTVQPPALTMRFYIKY